ncbi:MAG: cysteine--tRNA ligase [Gammaproteobacteria bacterium]|nr:cysteine--tRNA ligase [Gammaproteobacteria bacterium]
MLQIYNSLSKKKQQFAPIDPNNVRMYVCGMTVYDYCHVGHARAMVVFDVVYRYLRRIYGKGHVTYVRNITDIDDKIIARAHENHEDIDMLTARFIQEMYQDGDLLGVLRPDHEPRATQHIDEIIGMIKTLMTKGLAYAKPDSDVYYDVSAFKQYGALSGKHLDELRSVDRVVVDDKKDDPLDRVLWKLAKPGEPSWDSPWGAGRPGWDIECSAMATHCLGEHFDIHGGGLDLQFPHHENEIAQSEGASGETFVNFWMHNGHVRVDNEKMSKSLGNFFTIREVLAKYNPEVIRYFIVNSHYRSPLNYSDQHLENAKSGLTTLYTALRGLPLEESVTNTGSNGFSSRFAAAMDDDFNTPIAMAVLFDIAGECNKLKEHDVPQALKLGVQLKQLGALLGLLQCEPDDFLQGVIASGEGGVTVDQIEALIEQRNQARHAKDFQASDRIRQELAGQGVVLEDGAGGGTTWRRE